MAARPAPPATTPPWPTSDLQHFTLEANEVENCKFNIYTPGTKERRTFILGNDYCCAGMTGRGYIDSRMVFVGYGIDDEEYNEYAKVDVQGQIVVVLTGLPEHPWLPSTVTDHYTTLRDKARAAERHGAIGMLAINTSPSCLPYEPQGRIYCGEPPHMGTFPVLQLTLDCGRELLLDEDIRLEEAIDNIENGIKAEFKEYEGYGHEWRIWDIEIQRMMDLFGLKQVRGNS